MEYAGPQISNTVEVELLAVLTFNLEQNYPNPFNPITKINFSIPEESSVKLIVFNTIGQEVLTLVEDVIAAGRHDIIWDAVDASSGIYFYTIEVSSLETNEIYNSTRKMILLK